MTNHSEWCIKEPGNNCVNCCQTCSNCEEKESEDDMSDTPRTDEACDYTAPEKLHALCKELERELSIESAEKVKYRERAWHAESQLETRYGLRKEINAELGLTDETGDDALRKGLETIKALKQVERASCDMARVMIPLCSDCAHCSHCRNLELKTCPARVFLAERRQPDAWEVK